MEVTSSYEPSSHTVPVSEGGPPAPTQGCLGGTGRPAAAEAMRETKRERWGRHGDPGSEAGAAAQGIVSGL